MRHWALILSFASFLSVCFAAQSYAAPYEMAMVPPAATYGPSYFRIDVETGEVMSVSGGQYSRTTDATPLPPGDYHLFPQVDQKGTWWLYRMDSKTGRTWFLLNNAWSEVSPPK
ncbi:MAG TPA: hypothetical protein VKV77_10785 [Methylovirgula sp.]|nr:hypothetical protein [Methylovirgula sp.]